MYLEWDNNLNIGIQEIDEQHKELFKCLNQLLVSMKDGQGKSEVIKTLNFLEDYVYKHFEDEENIQKKYNYPKYNEQHNQHEQFKEELKKLRESFQKQGTSTILALNVQKNIVTWCKNHIMILDKELGDYLNKNSFNK
jgi:hemerythrin